MCTPALKRIHMAAAGEEAITYTPASKFFQHLKIHIPRINFTFSNYSTVEPESPSRATKKPDA